MKKKTETLMEMLDRMIRKEESKKPFGAEGLNPSLLCKLLEIKTKVEETEVLQRKKLKGMI
jgi:hypothetical protein